MQRRTLLKRFGTAGVAAVGFSGAAAASTGLDAAFGREIDVSGVSGPTPLVDLVPDADVDPDVNLVVNEETDSVEIESDCCFGWDCCENVRNCGYECHCCTCYGCQE